MASTGKLVLVASAVIGLLFASVLAVGASPARADEVIKIQIGKDYQEYSHADLQRRVWELEKAVWQLQNRIFELEGETPPLVADSWVCTVSAMGDTYTGTGGTKAVATANSLDNCRQKARDSFFCSKAKCEQ